MRKLAIGLVFLFVGCGTLHEKYVNQDRSNFDTLAPRVRKLMETSEHYTAEQEGDIEDRLQLWDARVTQAEATLKKEKEAE
jgi:hypothetical protein